MDYAEPVYTDRRQRISYNFSSDDMLAAVIIVLIFCIIVLLVWAGSPVLAPYFARQQEQEREHNLVRNGIIFRFDDAFLNELVEVDPDHDRDARGIGDIRERLHDEVEVEEHQARQDAGEPEPDAGERLQNAVEEHFREMTRHANDTQNVHDQVIVKAHSLKYRRLLELRIKDPEHKEFVARMISQGYKVRDIRGMETDQAFREIQAHAKANVTDTERLQRITTVLEGIGRGDTSVSLTGRPVKDIWVLTLIWKRIHHTDNTKTADDMCGILMDQLYDGATGDAGGILGLVGAGTVCIGGRIGRIMSVLTRMDADEVLAKPELDVKELTNEASAKCPRLIKEIMDENPTQAMLYAKQPNELNPRQQAEVERFERKIKERIDESLRADYKNLLSEHELTKLITTMQAGIG